MASNNQQQELPFPKCQKSWARVLEIGKKDESKSFGPLFYKTLFHDFPFLKEQDFKGTSMADQKMNLPGFITTALSLLGDMPKAVEALQQLGLRHVLYGTKPAYYPVVGANIIKTLKQILPADEFGADVQEEWGTLYGVIQKTVIDVYDTERAVPYWKKFWKKRGGEFHQIIDGVETATKTGIKQNLAQVALTVKESQSVAAVEALASGLSAEQLDKLKENLIASIEASKKTKVGLHDEWIIDWFVDAVKKGATKTQGCSACCGGNAVLFGGLVAAVGVAVWFFLNNKKNTIQ